MCYRFLPGLLFAVLLTTYFCLTPEDAIHAAYRNASPNLSIPTESSGHVQASTPMSHVDRKFELPEARFGFPTISGVPSSLSRNHSESSESIPAFLAFALPMPTSQPRPTLPSTSSSIRPQQRDPIHNISVPSPTTPLPLSMEEPAARQDNLPTIASNTAFAMMARGRSAVPLAAPSYPEFPDKGIRLTAQMLSFNAKQKPRDLGMGFYKTNGNRYQLSFLYDCSIDSSLGVSLSYLDTDVKSLHNDFRVKNTVTGYEASADYDGFLMGKFPMRGSAFYGRADTKTDGHIMAGGFGVPTPLAWHEDRHRSTLYGFSGRIGVPLLYGDDIKFMPELGFHYAQLRSRSYDVAVANAAAPLRMPSQRSSTFTIPLTATVKRDFLHCWGLITPKITGGIVRELSDKAAAFNGYNGSAATRMYYDGPTGIASEPGYDKAAKWSWHVGVGVDVKTVGGWEVSADYRRNWSEKYGGNEFKLELARCF